MKYFSLLAVLMVKVLVFGQPGSLDSTFNSNFYNQFGNGGGPSGIIEAISEQADGKLLVAGNFYTFNGKYTGPLVRLNENGGLDTNFHFGYANNQINTIAVQADSKILIGGFFTQYDGSEAYKIFRLNQDGSMDDTFYANIGGSTPSWVNSIVVQDNGKILAGGQFGSSNGQVVSCIVRLNEDGSNDPDFDAGLGCLNGEVKTIKIDQNGLIMLGGTFNGFNNSSNIGVVRLHTDGSVDNIFTSGLASGDYVNNLMINPDNTIYVAGRFFSYNSIARKHVARIHPNGNLDPSFNAGELNDEVFGLESNSGNEVLITGSFTSINNQTNNRITCLNQSGSASATMDFGSGASGVVKGILRRSDGKTFAFGNFGLMQDYTKGNIARLNASGNVDLSFLPIPGTNQIVNKLIMLPDNKSIVAGYFNTYNDFPCNGIVMLNEDGTVDPAFQCDADSVLNFIDIIAIPGAYYAVVTTETSYLYRLIRLFENGQVDPSFVTTGILSNEIPQKITFQSDGKLLVIGMFQNTAGNPVKSVIRLNPDGTREPGFLLNPIIIGGGITTVEVQNDNKILVAGYFDYPSECASMVRYQPDGLVDNGFVRPCTGGLINRVILLEDGGCYIAGDFSVVNNFSTSNVARLDLNGVVDHSFSANTVVASDIALQADGKIIVASDYNSQGTLIFRLNTDGTNDNNFATTQYTSGGILSLGIQTDGKIIAAGSFNGGQEWNEANHIVRLKNDTTGVSPLQIAIHAINNDVRCSDPASCTTTGYLGQSPYTYVWSGGISLDSTAIFDSAGIYTCTVTDSYGYSKTLSVVISGVKYSNEFDLNGNFSSTDFRPGFESTAWIDAFNDGCVPVSGKLKLAYHPLLDFISSQPMPDSQNGDTLIWNFTNQTYDSAHIMKRIVFSTSTSAAIGDNMTFSLLMTPISGDVDSTNNLKSYRFPVVNGYDPNFKAVYPIGKCDENYIEPDQTLTYTLHFQNTGNSEAINIAVLDSLDPNLDISTLRIVGKSHEMWTEYNTGNVLNFHFDAIHLPDSSSNEPGSHGYVIFEIKPHTWLAHKSMIENNVGIYFDFNPPVITNTVRNKIYSAGDLNTLNCLENGIEDDLYASIALFPNPAEDQVTILFDFPHLTLEVFDLCGQKVFSLKEIQNEEKISLENWQSGMYLFHMSAPSGKKIVKLIKN